MLNLCVMARKESAISSRHHGANDLVGIGVFVVAFLLLVALFSYDAKDLRINAVPPNKITHNWIGIVGAGVAWATLSILGIAAYLVPVLLLGFGLGYFFEALRYLRHRWIWAVTLLISSAGLLDLYGGHFATIQRNLNALPGGWSAKSSRPCS